jgi:hypothetical protein
VFKCDNLYIDMNGIVHNATHGKMATKEEFESQVKQNLFYSLDRILFAAQPQKLLYMALGTCFLLRLFPSHLVRWCTTTRKSSRTKTKEVQDCPCAEEVKSSRRHNKNWYHFYYLFCIVASTFFLFCFSFYTIL